MLQAPKISHFEEKVPGLPPTFGLYLASALLLDWLPRFQKHELLLTDWMILIQLLVRFQYLRYGITAHV